MPAATEKPISALIGSSKLFALAALSALLLELAFPLAGPMPAWRSLFAWFGLAPLLWALAAAGSRPRPLRLGFQLGYLAGILWYMGNCYWVRDTMMKYGDMPPFAPELLLLGFSLYLGLYWGFFGLCFAAVQKRFSTPWALAAAPFLWIATDLAAARITSFPWDQLGYSQIDNGLLTCLAPWTGVYGISFLLVAANALLVAAAVLPQKRQRVLVLASGCLLVFLGALGLTLSQPAPAPTATAVLIQPNLEVSGVGFWNAPGEWEQHMATFGRLANQQCKTYLAGIPETGAPSGEIICPPYPTHPDLVVWPESPAPYFQEDPRYHAALQQLTTSTQAPFIVGTVGMDLIPAEHDWREFNSALITGQDGKHIGRYDKIHLVPFGEYVPFQRFLFFARKLTGKVSRFDRGTEHQTFLVNGHRYGIFICYEAVFADEVRKLSKNGAEALVNISDDGWYGNTSAPWQHLNMTRMRAIENRRWIVRATNNGITASIDPYGHVRQSIPRHAEDALPAGYAFQTGTTFYTAHGDLFAWLCALLSLALLGWARLSAAFARS